jgi:hypothetical protein
MCHFVTLIVPTGDVDAVRSVMERHGRVAQPIANPSVRQVLREGEWQYLTTASHCDCGTILAPRHDTPEAFEKRLAKEAVRMQRKGWSEAKIARAMEDRRKADAKPRGAGADSLELWNAVLADLGRDLKLPYAGLFVRFYSGNIGTEIFSASRRQVPEALSRLDAFGTIEHDEVTIFRLN